MGLITLPVALTANLVPTAAQWTSLFSTVYNEVNGQLDSANVDKTSSDGIMVLDTAQTRTAKLTMSTAGIALSGAISASSWTTTGIVLSAAAATYTDSSTAGSGTAATATFHSFAQPTLAATNSSVTTTDAATVYIANAPTAGTNQTITNAYSLWVAAGASRFGGAITVGVDDTGYDAKFFTATSGSYVLVDESADQLVLSAATYRQTAGNMYLGDSANAGMTQGMTLNQGANDDEILAAKSSDVAHGLTSLAETDTYLSVRKASGTQGGVQLRTLCEDDTLDATLQIYAYGGTAGTTQTSGGDALISLNAAEHDGSNGLANITAGGNVFAIRARVGGGTRALFIVDEDGDFLYDGADGGAFDTHDDLALLDTFSVVALTGAQKAGRDWLKYNKDDLVKAGIIGYCSPEEEAKGHTGLVNGSALNRLFVGAFGQVGKLLRSMQGELKTERKHRAKLEKEIKLLKGAA